MDEFFMLAQAFKLLRTEIDKKDIPAYWLEFFLYVAAEGDKGVTTREISEKIGMDQGVSSRMVKLLSQYYDKSQGKVVGPDLFVVQQDHIHRHRQRVFLSDKGKGICTKLQELFK